MDKTKKQIMPQDLYNVFNENKNKNGNDIEAAIQLLEAKYGKSNGIEKFTTKINQYF